MTYLRRALKYFIQITLIFAVIMAVLMLSGLVSKDIGTAFRNGWKAVDEAKGDPAEHWPVIDEVMTNRGYVKAGETPEGGRKYHLYSTMNRAARLWEDSITINPVLGGFQAEGLVRDLVRVLMSLDRKLNNHEN